MMSQRENRLRAFRFQQPEWIPLSAGLPPLMFEHYDPGALEELMLTHPIIYPGYQEGDFDHTRWVHPPHQRKDELHTDGWGCVWQTSMDGMIGAVVKHPLEDWDSLAAIQPPDPDRNDGMLPIDWQEVARWVAQAREKSELVACWLPHGHTLLRAQDMRGYVNMIYDMADEEPRLDQLLGMICEFNLEVIRRFAAFQPDMIGIPEDLGMQTSPLISPEQFRRYIKPHYKRMIDEIHGCGALVHEHADGYILDLIDDVIDAGSDIVNIQDLVNGIDNIRDHIKGRVAIDLDIDRQNITVNGSPKDVDDLVREAVVKLGSREGGLSLAYQPWPPTPIENIRAVLDAMEKYCTYHA